jgi:hypothetical protein
MSYRAVVATLPPAADCANDAIVSVPIHFQPAHIRPMNLAFGRSEGWIRNILIVSAGDLGTLPQDDPY